MTEKEEGRFLASLGITVVPLSLTAIFLKNRIAVIKEDLVRTSLFFCPDSAPWSDEHEN